MDTLESLRSERDAMEALAEERLQRFAAKMSRTATSARVVAMTRKRTDIDSHNPIAGASMHEHRNIPGFVYAIRAARKGGPWSYSLDLGCSWVGPFNTDLDARLGAEDAGMEIFSEATP
jgi:hypothetical protein